MATTPNYGWVMPNPTDFVTNLPADFELFGDAVDATVEAIETKLDVITTEGDLVIGDSSGDPDRLPIGTGGRVLTSNGTTATWEPVPQSGINWNLQKRENEIFNVSTSQACRGAAYLNGEYWIWGTGGLVARSTDGITWTTVSIGSTNNINKVFYSSSLSLYIAIFDGGVLRTSTNGTSWTARTSTFTSSNINGIAEKAGVLVIVGADGKGASSTTGTAWTLRTMNNSTNTFYNVAASANEFVAVATAGGSSRSTDGTTWALQSGQIGVDIVYANSGFFIYDCEGTSRAIRFSVQGTSWQNNSNLRQVFRGKNIQRNTFAIIDSDNFLTIGTVLPLITSDDNADSPFITKINTNVSGGASDLYITTSIFAASPIAYPQTSGVFIVYNAGDIMVVGTHFGIYTSF